MRTESILNANMFSQCLELDVHVPVDKLIPIYPILNG